MTRTTMAIVSLLLVGLMSVAGFVVASALPEGAQLPIHWGLDGPDQFSDKWAALLLPPVIAGGVSLLLYFLPALEPRQDGLARSQGLYFSSWAAALVIPVMIQLAEVSIALHWGLPLYQLIVGGLGAAFVLMGNQLAKSRRMYMIGIRTPWTLASEEVWIRTHRLGGKLMVAAGAVLILLSLARLPSGMFATLTAVVLASAVGVPIVYSYLLWRQEGRSDPGIR